MDPFADDDDEEVQVSKRNLFDSASTIHALSSSESDDDYALSAKEKREEEEICRDIASTTPQEIKKVRVLGKDKSKMSFSSSPRSLKDSEIEVVKTGEKKKDVLQTVKEDTSVKEKSSKTKKTKSEDASAAAKPKPVEKSLKTPHFLPQKMMIQKRRRVQRWK